MWALSGHAHADGPMGLDITELIKGAATHASAGTTFRGPGNWRAKLFVSDLGTRNEEDGPMLRSSTTVGAQLSVRIAKSTHVSIDVFNVFDRKSGEVDYFTGARIFRQPGTLDGYLSHPAEGRGFRLSLSARF
jgi:outer membrane receptor protein involved in Fe transport